MKQELEQALLQAICDGDFFMADEIESRLELLEVREIYEGKCK